MRTFPSPSPAPPTAACRRSTPCGSPQLVSTPRPRWPVLTRRRMAGFDVSIEVVEEAFSSNLATGQPARADPNHVGFWFAAPAGDHVCFGAGEGGVTPFD